MNAILTSVQRLAQLQRQSIDKQALQMCLTDIMAGTLNLHKALKKLNDQMQWASVRFISSSDFDPSHLPCLAITKQGECLVLKSYNAQLEWVIESATGESSITSLQNFDLIKID